MIALRGMAMMHNLLIVLIIAYVLVRFLRQLAKYHRIYRRMDCTCDADPLGRCVVHKRDSRPIDEEQKNG